MSNASERIKEKMNNMSYEELNNKTKSQRKKERTSFGKKVLRLLTWRLRLLPVIFGYDDKDVTDPIGTSRGPVSHGRPVPPPDPNRAFREEQRRLTPTEYIEINRHVDLYRSLVDGKGDHDCDHEH